MVYIHAQQMVSKIDSKLLSLRVVAIDYMGEIMVEDIFEPIQFLIIVCIIETISDRLSMPTNISADIYALMTSCWNTIPSSRPTINQVQQRLKQSIKSEILATPRVSLNMISSWELWPISYGYGFDHFFRVISQSKDQSPQNNSTSRQAKQQQVVKNYKYP